MEHLYFTNINISIQESQVVPLGNSGFDYKMRGIYCSLYPLWLRRHLRRHLTFFPQRPIPYPFHLGRLSAYSTVWPKQNMLAYYNIRHFHLGRTVSHVNTRAHFDGTESCAALFESSKRFWIWRRGLLKSKQKYWGTLILNNHPTLKHLLFK